MSMNFEDLELVNLLDCNVCGDALAEFEFETCIICEVEAEQEMK